MIKPVIKFSGVKIKKNIVEYSINVIYKQEKYFMGARKVNKKKTIMGTTIIIALTVITIIAIASFNMVNAKKISNSIELGIKQLTEENYDKAKGEFSKALSIDEDHEEAMELLTLTEQLIELNYLYKNKEYVLASELLTELKENKNLELIEEKINDISTNVEEKIRIIGEIDNIDNDINQLLGENKYNEAIELVDKYLNEDLKDEYLNKLNNIKIRVNESKIAYEEEQRVKEEQRLAEEKRLEEEKKAEEERKLKEQQKTESRNQSQNQNQNATDNSSQEMISKEIVKKILDGRINNCETTFENYDSPIVFEKNGVVYWAYKQIWNEQPGGFLIIDMFTGKVIVSEKLDFDHGDADFYYPGY